MLTVLHVSLFISSAGCFLNATHCSHLLKFPSYSFREFLAIHIGLPGGPLNLTQLLRGSLAIEAKAKTLCILIDLLVIFVYCKFCF